MIYNLLTTSSKQLVLSAYSSNELSLYCLEKHEYSIFDSFLDKSKYPVVPFEALVGTKIQTCFTYKENQRYAVYSTIFDLSAFPKWEFGTVYGIVSYKSQDSLMSFRVIDLSLLMHLHQVKNIIDVFSIWRTEQLDYYNCNLYGILIIISTKRTIVDNIYIEVMNLEARELSLHSADRYYSANSLLNNIYQQVIKSVDIDQGSQSIDAKEVMTRDNYNPWKYIINIVNYPYTLKIRLSNLVDSELTGKLDYSTIGCQGFGDLIIQNSHGRILLLHPNASLVGDYQNRVITLNYLISKTYSLD